MALGFGRLRLSPRDFWSMTPREFERAASVFLDAGTTGPDRSALTRLMSIFPDTHG